MQAGKDLCGYFYTLTFINITFQLNPSVSKVFICVGTLWRQIGVFSYFYFIFNRVIVCQITPQNPLRENPQLEIFF